MRKRPDKRVRHKPSRWRRASFLAAAGMLSLAGCSSLDSNTTASAPDPFLGPEPRRRPELPPLQLNLSPAHRPGPMQECLRQLPLRIRPSVWPLCAGERASDRRPGRSPYWLACNSERARLDANGHNGCCIDRGPGNLESARHDWHADPNLGANTPYPEQQSSAGRAEGHLAAAARAGASVHRSRSGNARSAACSVLDHPATIEAATAVLKAKGALWQRTDPNGETGEWLFRCGIANPKTNTIHTYEGRARDQLGAMQAALDQINQGQ